MIFNIEYIKIEQIINDNKEFVECQKYDSIIFKSKKI